MPKRELRHPYQIIDWLKEWGEQLKIPGEMTLIGSAGLLWHVSRIGLDVPLPENSMDADPVTDSDEIAELSYNALIGSEFERIHGWHVNLMPSMVLEHLPSGWQDRAYRKTYALLTVVVPAPPDLLAPKIARNEPRDRQHVDLAQKLGLI